MRFAAENGLARRHQFIFGEYPLHPAETKETVGSQATSDAVFPRSDAPGPEIVTAQNYSIPQEITPEERWHIVAVAAYHRAKERDFVGGDLVEDWLAAEAEIDAELRSSVALNCLSFETMSKRG